MKIHINARNHVCDLCGKGFKFVTSLKKHATVHSQERNFECQICRKKFKTIAALRQHNLLHQVTDIIYILHYYYILLKIIATEYFKEIPFFELWYSGGIVSS